MLAGILTGLGVTALLWILYRGIQGNREAFSKENLLNSGKTLGILGLLLIGIVGFAVLMLKR